MLFSLSPQIKNSFMGDNLKASEQIMLSLFLNLKFLLKMENTDQCLCGGLHRRHFLKLLLPGVVGLSILQLAEPARANQARALVLSCIDFRFVKTESDFLEMKNLAGEYDWTALAGASLALTGFPHPADAETFWDQLNISDQLHHIQKVIILDHQDCGAYAMMVDSNLSQDPERELQVHTDYLNQAYWSIHHRYPHLQIELYFATLNPNKLQPILPKLI
jgi:hypothetical protein